MDKDKQTPLEDKIKLLLVMRGYKGDRVSFDDYDNLHRLLRYKYWKPIADKDIKEIEVLIKRRLVMLVLEDTDCGNLVMYRIGRE